MNSLFALVACGMLCGVASAAEDVSPVDLLLPQPVIVQTTPSVMASTRTTAKIFLLIFSSLTYIR